MSLCLVTVPVLLDTTTDAALLYRQWARMYHYGHLIIPAMAVGTSLLYGYTCTQKREAQKPWGLFAWAGLVTVSIAPFTWIFMVPINDELFRLESATNAEPSPLGLSEAKQLVLRWSWLHFTRSLLPLMGAILGILGTF